LTPYAGRIDVATDPTRAAAAVIRAMAIMHPVKTCERSYFIDRTACAAKKVRP